MKIGYDFDLYERGYNIPINLDENSYKHLSLTGASGTGKSYALIYLISNYLKKYGHNIDLYFCDFKNEYEVFSQCKKYYDDESYYLGLESFYLRFKARKKKEDLSSNMIICILEEWPSYLIYLNNTDKSLYKKSVAYIQELLMQGRSFNCCVWVIGQRLDAKYFPDGIRESIHTIIALGKLSSESKKMIGLNADYELLERDFFDIGEGVVVFNDNRCLNIKFPKIKNYSEVLLLISKFLD